MGLRETKALRTRDTVHRVTLDLVERNGFDAVTIEQIADAAEIGVSTLYRYFPNKDAILLHPVTATVGLLAQRVRERPAGEPVGTALGRALTEHLSASFFGSDEVVRLRAQLDVAPGPRARVWDLWNQERVLLEEAIAERTGFELSDLRVALAAGVTMTVMQISLDLHRDRVDEPPSAELAVEMLRLLDSSDAFLPRAG
jgi:AcrR family transcriptional regulator